MQYPFNTSIAAAEHSEETIEIPYCRLFLDLLKRIDQCMMAELPETERLQNCFWTSVQCYRKLKELVLDNGLKNESDEIYFFRNVKPKFASFIEFFVLCTEAMWFVENKVQCAASFWREELEKYSRFCNRYNVFIRYYQSGDNRHDSAYFLRTTADALSDIHSKMFDEHPILHSSKDWILRSYLANKMYFRFAQEKLDSVLLVQNEKNVVQNRYGSGLKNAHHAQDSFSALLVDYMNS